MSNVDEINFDSLLYTIEQAFDEYTSVVGRPNDVTIEGIYLVGSVLTDSFVEGDSDLDFYVRLSKDYDKSDGFRRLLNDPDEFWGQELNQTLPNKFDQIDMLGCVTDDSTIRTPNKYIPS